MGLYNPPAASSLNVRLRDLTETILPGAAPLQATTAKLLLGSAESLSGGSLSGTYLGIRHTGSFLGNFVDFQTGAEGSRFRVSGSGAVLMAGALTLGSGGATLTGDSDGTFTAVSPHSGDLFRVGGGTPLGQPEGTPTLAANGAGALVGTYQYAYTETVASGETTLSASASIVAASNTVRVTVPLARRGVDTRKLYRTAAGGATFKLLHDFSAGEGYHQTTFDDNVVDGSLGATAPSSDTTVLHECSLAHGVHHFRTHPSLGSDPADVTFTTGNPSVAGAYGIHNYTSYRGQVANGSGIGLLCTGDDCTAIHVQWNPVVYGVAPVDVFKVDADGKVRITCAQQLTDAEPNALLITATMPETITQTRSGISATITSAGNSSFQQNGMAITFAAGYVGNQPTNGLSVVSSVATTSTGGAIQGWSQAGARAVGVIGRASGGTNNMGLMGLTNLAPESLTGISGAIIASNGDQTTRILGLYDNTSLALEVQDGGYVVARGVGTGSAAAGVADSVLSLGAPAGGLQARGVQGSGGAALRVTGAGNNVFWGHSNSEYLCTLGGHSGSGVPFIGWYCYHGPNSNTQRYASGTNLPVKIQVSTAGILTIQEAAAGSVDTDITFSTRWTLNGTNGNVTMTGDLTMADGEDVIFGTTTGGSLGAAANQKTGMHGARVIQNAGWSVTNPSTTKTLDVSSADLATVRAVLGTVIDACKEKGIFGA